MQKKIFDYVCQSFDMGKLCSFHPRRLIEEIDLSQFNIPVSLSSVTRLEDLNQIKKKNGIMLLFDPSINTYNEMITIRIIYMKSIDLNTEEEITKHYQFSSNGNYFHMTLIKDNYRGHNDDNNNTNVNGISNTGSGKYSSNNENPVNSTNTANEEPNERHQSHNNLPGWNNRPPLYIPASKCSIQIVDLGSYSQNAALTNSLTRLKIYGVSCPGARAGIRRLQETLDSFMVQQTKFNVTKWKKFLKSCMFLW